MNEIAKKAYTLMNDKDNWKTNIGLLSMEEIQCLLITCDGIGKDKKTAVLTELLKRVSNK